ncbi:hypothetical protein DSM112329_03153 [Paraconexibacter sp. AEG42_29]|uniref:Uncharacterized protein n=1 Tax=Paraconexibacter sp. AEG42_29 TaxID=2997339 RepID=A0AAU7AXT0_9ACTN
MPEPESRNLHRSSTRLLSALMLVLGVAMIVSTLVRGGGALAIGLVMGVLFVGAGGGRLYVSLRSG